jgi:hypothetical protein
METGVTDRHGWAEQILGSASILLLVMHFFPSIVDRQTNLRRTSILEEFALHKT